MKAHSGKQTLNRFDRERAHAYRIPTKEDNVQQDMTDKATDAAIAFLKPIVKANPNKLLANIARHEVEGMVVVAITAFEKRRKELAVLEELNDDVSDIGA